MSTIGFPDGQRITQWLGAPIVQAAARAIGNVLVEDGPFNLASWASVILAVKPTGGNVTATIRQKINGGPAGLELDETFVVPVGQTLFTSVVLFADTVYLDLTGSAPGVTVDYALYPANTTTNAQVLASANLNFQKNEVLVSAEPTLDVVDASGLLAWTLTDDPTNTRVKLSAVKKASVAAAYSTVATAIPNAAAGVQVILNALGVNTDGYSILNGTIIVPRTGYYSATSLAQWAAAAGGYREVGIWIYSGAGAPIGVVAFNDEVSIGAGGFHYVPAYAGVVNLAAGQGLGVQGVQNSGGPLNWNAGSAPFPQLAIEFLGA